MALTTAQQDQYNKLQEAVSVAQMQYNAALNAVASATNATNTCKAARDAVTFGWQKEKACSQNTFSSLIAAQAAAENDRNAKEAALNNAKKALADFQALVDQQNTQATTALQGNASYNLQSQQNALNALAAQNAAAETERKKKQFRTIIWIVLSAIGLTGVGFAVYYFGFKRPKKTEGNG